MAEANHLQGRSRGWARRGAPAAPAGGSQTCVWRNTERRRGGLDPCHAWCRSGQPSRGRAEPSQFGHHCAAATQLHSVSTMHMAQASCADPTWQAALSSPGKQDVAGVCKLRGNGLQAAEAVEIAGSQEQQGPAGQQHKLRNPRRLGRRGTAGAEPACSSAFQGCQLVVQPHTSMQGY